MEIHVAEAATLVEVAFVAPVPAGHEVIVLHLELEGAGWLDTSEAEVIVDATAGTVYADVAYFTVMKRRGLPAGPPAHDPVAILGPGWRPKRSMRGRAVGALVSTKDGGEANHAYTLLHVVPLAAEPGYRG